MAVKAVAFDLGGTLIDYPFPLNWQKSFPAALTRVLEALGEPATPQRLAAGAVVLDRFNTRTHPREREVQSEAVFTALFQQWGLERTGLMKAKSAFYSYFQAETRPYPEAKALLCALKARGLRTGLLTDVAYGMDPSIALRDVEALAPWLDVKLASTAVGWRKPNPAGFQLLLKQLGASPAELLFVGDEQKDIQGANRLGIGSVLLDRQGSGREFGQRYTIATLDGLLELCE